MMYISTIKRLNTPDIHAHTYSIPIFDIKCMSDTEFQVYVSVYICLYQNCIACIYLIHLYLHLSIVSVVILDFSAKIPHFSAKHKIFLQIVKNAETRQNTTRQELGTLPWPSTCVLRRTTRCNRVTAL